VADAARAGLRTAWAGVRGDQGQPLTAIGGDVTEVLAREVIVFQIVLLLDERAVTVEFIGVDEALGEVARTCGSSAVG
jgi:hypothetical protein